MNECSQLGETVFADRCNARFTSVVRIYHMAEGSLSGQQHRWRLIESQRRRGAGLSSKGWELSLHRSRASIVSTGTFSQV
jgi:hypothetical protein